MQTRSRIIVQAAALPNPFKAASKLTIAALKFVKNVVTFFPCLILKICRSAFGKGAGKSATLPPPSPGLENKELAAAPLDPALGAAPFEPVKDFDPVTDSLKVMAESTKVDPVSPAQKEKNQKRLQSTKVDPVTPSEKEKNLKRLQAPYKGIIIKRGKKAKEIEEAAAKAETALEPAETAPSPSAVTAAPSPPAVTSSVETAGGVGLQQAILVATTLIIVLASMQN